MLNLKQIRIVRNSHFTQFNAAINLDSDLKSDNFNYMVKNQL
jgi:hypothetical protein